MKIIIDKLDNIEVPLSYIKLIEEVIMATIVYEKCPYEVEVSIYITNNDEIKGINKSYRDIDKSTDVLSFPLINFNKPSDFTIINPDSLDFNLDTNDLMLGDIILSIDKAKEQALEYNHSIEREIGFLIVHSMLHLFGYDHIEKQDADEMFLKQKLILDKVGLKR